VSGPFAGIKMNQKIRYALLAGTMLPAVAVPQASMATSNLSTAPAQGLIILAQGGAAPATEPQPKGPQPKGAQPKGSPPGGARVTPPGTPPQGVQPRQLGVQPKGTQPLQGQQNIAPGGGQPPTGQGTPPQGVQPRQLGVQPKGTQPLQGQQNIAPGGGQPPTGQGGAAQRPGAPLQSVQPRQLDGGPQPGLTGNVEQLRMQRQERRDAGGRVVIEEPGRRFIVRENGRAFIRHDETERFRRWGGEPQFERRGGEQYAYISRPGGYQIITVTDGSGRLLRRIRRGPDGREVILIDNRVGTGVGVVGVGLAAGVILGLAAPMITLPRERYIVDVSAAPAPLLYETLEAPPLVEIERPYSLDEIRFNVTLRDRMRRIDIDSITFDSGSWEVMPEQQPKLEAVADAMRRILARNPDEIFLIEGHTDAVGDDVDNLSLSDRRAESVAVILTEVYQTPPENLVTQGYGEQYLKVPTDGPSRENRRVTARRITPLLQGASR
jgi:outer membrane protein OmpA-like peptidoglycan-associated protein